MIKLQGIAYHSGHIEFSREENQWAFEKIDSEMKSGQERRIRFDPAIAPVEIRASEMDEGNLPWLEQTQLTLQTADSIYLQKHRGFLRFRQAIHNVGTNQKFITLGGQEEVNNFAAEHWSKLRYFFAVRRDIVKFDMVRLITWKPSDMRETRTLELITRLDANIDEVVPRITFDCSGSKSDVEIVEWRSGVKEGEKGKFFPEERHIQMVLTQAHQPFTFLQEFREEFDNYSYTFADEQLTKKLNRVIKKKLKTETN